MAGAPERCSKLLVAPLRARRPRRTGCSAGRRRWRQSAFPLSVPQGGPSAAQACGLGAPGGGLSASLQPSRCPRRVVAPCCSVDRTRQRPATHRTHPTAVEGQWPPLLPGSPRYAVKPEQPVSWGGDVHRVPIASEATKACKPVQEGTGGRQKIWYRVGVGSVRAVRPAVTASLGGGYASRLPPPPHKSTDPIGGPAPPPAARGPLLIFRKIHLYGKTKKSTHDHQNGNAASTSQMRAGPTHPRDSMSAGARVGLCLGRIGGVG